MRFFASSIQFVKVRDNRNDEADRMTRKQMKVAAQQVDSQ